MRYRAAQYYQRIPWHVALSRSPQHHPQPAPPLLSPPVLLPLHAGLLRPPPRRPHSSPPLLLPPLLPPPLPLLQWLLLCLLLPTLPPLLLPLPPPPLLVLPPAPLLAMQQMHLPTAGRTLRRAK